MVREPGALRQLWWRWKSLRLPWRKQWLVGFDLSGNTFWEFQDQINAGRVRRIARYTAKTHLGDVNLSPQWVQWLRHTRSAPPSINEQQLDEIRQAQMKMLAKEADARWAAKPSALDRPKQAAEALLDSVPKETRSELVQQSEDQTQVHDRDEVAAQDTMRSRTEVEDVPKQADNEAMSTPTPAAQQLQQTQQSPTFKTSPSQFKSKDFKGFKLGKEGEQQPDSWVPKARRR